MTTALRRGARVGFGLVMAGLIVQIGASFFWSPAAFMVLAGLGMPLVLVGVLLVWRGTRVKA
jgi:hypothetical protein